MKTIQHFYSTKYYSALSHIKTKHIHHKETDQKHKEVRNQLNNNWSAWLNYIESKYPIILHILYQVIDPILNIEGSKYSISEYANDISSIAVDIHKTIQAINKASIKLGQHEYDQERLFQDILEGKDILIYIFHYFFENQVQIATIVHPKR